MEAPKYRSVSTSLIFILKCFAKPTTSRAGISFFVLYQWDLQSNSLPPSSTEGYGVPTSIDFVRTETSQMVASYSSAQCVIYDLETAAPVVALDSAKTYSKYAHDSLSSQFHHKTVTSLYKNSLIMFSDYMQCLNPLPPPQKKSFLFIYLVQAGAYLGFFKGLEFSLPVVHVGCLLKEGLQKGGEGGGGGTGTPEPPYLPPGRGSFR